MKIGEVIKTQYFGDYTEIRDSDLPVEELVGKVIVRAPRDGSKNAHAYLFVTENGETIRFDIPDFMKTYDKHNVAVLCRRYTKKAKQTEKVYHKMIVISVKDLTAAASLK